MDKWQEKAEEIKDALEEVKLLPEEVNIIARILREEFSRPEPAKNAMELAKRIGNECHSKHGDDYYEEEAAALIQSSFEAWKASQPSQPCPDCGGEGYTAQHNPAIGSHDGEGNCLGGCPVPVQCERCEGTGKIAFRQSESESSGEWLRERMIALRDAGDKTLVNLADWNRGYDRAINDSLSLLASRPAESAKEEE